MKCNICPHYCQIPINGIGKCGVVKNVQGKICTTEHFSIVAVEAIEKRPFFHFTPGKSYVSAGFFGCSFSCDFCQNYRISQDLHGKRTNFSDIDPVKESATRGLAGIAFSFSEPLIYHEKIARVGESAKASHLRIAVKTNGFTTKKVIKGIRSFVDAYNVDIKGDDDDYRRLGGWKNPVLRAVEAMVELGHHVEISYLVLPQSLHNDKLHRRTANWLAKMSPAIPVHLLYTYPCYKMDDSYAQEDILSVYNIFREFLSFVYVSNLYSESFLPYRNTICPDCGKLLIARSAGRTEVISSSCCSFRMTYP